MATDPNFLYQLQQQANFAAGKAREAADLASRADARNAQLEQRLDRQTRSMQDLADALSSVKATVTGTGGAPDHIKFIEQVPGRRVPFDLLVRIPIGANVTSEQQQSTTISQDGPFVAVRRVAAFLSQHAVSYINPSTQVQSAFLGRTFGRWRPCHSMWDINDAQAGVMQSVTGGPMPGAGQAIFASPSNMSSFRSMEFDGLIKFLNQGAGYPRSNDQIPSAWYSEQINSPYDLPALDFFEKGESLQWLVTPTHANNAAYGNLSGFGATGVYPFLPSQFDVQEGINDPELLATTTDPITRLPNGILFIGFSGYRIIQPPGVVRPQ